MARKTKKLEHQICTKYYQELFSMIIDGAYTFDMKQNDFIRCSLELGIPAFIKYLIDQIKDDIEANVKRKKTLMDKYFNIKNGKNV